MRHIVVAVLLVSAWSCRSAVENAPGSVIGSYTLVTVDAAPLPFHGTAAFTVRGTVNLRNDGRYTLTQADSAAAGTVSNISAAGHWSLQENALALIDDTGPLQLAVVLIDTLRMSYRGHENVYVRR